MFEKKQNVFDDWFAAAEYLIANKYTSPQHFAITGRSNGGLLMGASITQRPELFSAVLCGYPLLDMLRYQKFLVGSYWKTEYGSAENEKQFPYLLKYSPYQNVKPGTAYPAVMFFTGDSDTRVDPLHARKMTPCCSRPRPAGGPSCCITVCPEGTRPGWAWNSRSRTMPTNSPSFGLKRDSLYPVTKAPRPSLAPGYSGELSPRNLMPCRIPSDR